MQIDISTITSKYQNNSAEEAEVLTALRILAQAAAMQHRSGPKLFYF